MPSSEGGDRRRWLVCRLLMAGCLGVASCSTVPVESQSVSTPTAPQCVVAESASTPPDAKAIAGLRQVAEAGPLYTALVGKAGLASCRISGDASRLALEYTFRDGGWLHVAHDPRIEYDNQEGRFASPLVEDGVAVLRRAEQLAFSPGGCGINWSQPETQPAGDDTKATERIYRGNVCNCQARVRTDAAGRVTGLVFRSAC